MKTSDSEESLYHDAPANEEHTLSSDVPTVAVPDTTTVDDRGFIVPTSVARKAKRRQQRNKKRKEKQRSRAQNARRLVKDAIGVVSPSYADQVMPSSSSSSASTSASDPSAAKAKKASSTSNRKPLSKSKGKGTKASAQDFHKAGSD